MNGVVIIDKPENKSSAQVVREVKQLLKAKKVGHTGTLDPFATGVLVCCINQATRLSQFFVQGKKCYEAVMRLGVETDTQDSTGQVISQASSLAVTNAHIEKAFQSFLAVKEQIPPSFSALKHKGVPLYKLARKGVLVEKPSRPITIYSLTITGVDMPFVKFQVCCSQGTYVRTLCSDIGKALGCGAHLVTLRRTESGGFGLGDAYPLDMLRKLAEKDLAHRCVISMNEALKGVPEIKVDDGLAQWIRHGRPVGRDNLGALDDGDLPWVKVTDGENLIAILDARHKDGVFPYKCVFSRTEGQIAY
jgi:tRNA pseudouridine55 synthase